MKIVHICNNAFQPWVWVLIICINWFSVVNLTQCEPYKSQWTGQQKVCHYVSFYRSCCNRTARLFNKETHFPQRLYEEHWTFTTKYILYYFISPFVSMLAFREEEAVIERQVEKEYHYTRSYFITECVLIN